MVSLPRPRLPSFRRGLTAGFGVLLGLVILVALAVPPILRSQALRALREAGFSQAHMSTPRWGWPGLRIARLTLAPGLSLNGVRLNIHPGRLTTGKAPGLSIDRIEAALWPEGPNGPLLTGLSRAAGTSGAPPSLPLAEATIRQARVTAQTAAGPISVTIADTGITRTNGRLAVRGTVTVDHAQARLAGLFNGQAALSMADPARLRLSLSRVDFGGQDWGPVALTAQGSGPESWTVAIRSRAPASLEADMTLTSTDSGAPLRADGTLHVPDLAALSALTGHATLSGGLAAEGTVRLDRAEPYGLAGEVHLALDKATLPGLKSVSASGTVALNGTVAKGAARLTHPLSLTGRIPKAGLPATLAAYRGQSLDLTFADGRLTWQGDRLHIETTLEAHSGPAQVRAHLRADRTPSGAIDLPDIAVESTGLTLPLGRLTLEPQRIAGRLSPTDQGARFDGSVTVKADGQWPKFQLEEAVLPWSGEIAYENEVVTLVADRCVQPEIKALTFGEARIEADPLPCLTGPAGTPLLRLDAGHGKAGFALTGEARTFSAQITQPTGARQIGGVWPAVSASGRLSLAGGLDRAALSFKDGALDWPAPALSAADIQGAAAIAEGALETASLRVARLITEGDPAPLAPVSLDMQADAAQSGPGLAISALLSDPLGLMVVEAQGHHDPGDGRGHANVTLYPIDFLPQAVELGDISPAAAVHAGDLEGRVSAEARLDWNAAGLTDSRATVSVNALSGTVAGSRIQGVSSRLRFANLAPLTTDGPQTIQVGLIDAGVPLTDGTVRLALPGNNTVRVRETRFTLAGGTLSAEPFIVETADPAKLTVALAAEDIALAPLLTISGIDGLTGDGQLTGRLPVALSGGGIGVTDGRLQAVSSGVLRYSPDNPPAFLQGDDMRTKMLRQVLQNFQYDRLSLSLSGQTMAQQTLTLSAAGRNPDFLEGHPVELNVNLAGNLVGALESAARTGESLQRLYRQRTPDQQPDEAPQ